MNNPNINVELIYALPSEQNIIYLTVQLGFTIHQAIEQSGILDNYPEINLEINKIGIFSKVSKLTDKLREGDRIEIYRQLIADPKEIRKQKALKQKD